MREKGEEKEEREEEKEEEKGGKGKGRYGEKASTIAEEKPGQSPSLFSQSVLTCVSLGKHLHLPMCHLFPGHKQTLSVNISQLL